MDKEERMVRKENKSSRSDDTEEKTEEKEGTKWKRSVVRKEEVWKKKEKE